MRDVSPFDPFYPTTTYGSSYTEFSQWASVQPGHLKAHYPHCRTVHSGEVPGGSHCSSPHRVHLHTIRDGCGRGVNPSLSSVVIPCGWYAWRTIRQTTAGTSGSGALSRLLPGAARTTISSPIMKRKMQRVAVPSNGPITPLPTRAAIPPMILINDPSAPAAVVATSTGV